MRDGVMAQSKPLVTRRARSVGSGAQCGFFNIRIQEMLWKKIVSNVILLLTPGIIE